MSAIHYALVSFSFFPVVTVSYIIVLFLAGQHCGILSMIEVISRVMMN